MMRLLVSHKGKKKKGQAKPSYSSTAQVLGLVKYCFRPETASKNRERVVGVIDGLDIGLTKDQTLSPAQIKLITALLVGDVPSGRRKIRQVLLCLSGDESLEDQLAKCPALVRQFVNRHAPGCKYIAVVHGDHVGEDGRGVHIHVLIANSNHEGQAIDWSREDLREQQSMEWAADLGFVPTRGTGVPRQKGTDMPYPKSWELDANKIGQMTEEEIYEHIKSGSITEGRRNKKGDLTSIRFRGRSIRLSTVRAIAERARGMAASGKAGRKQDGASSSRNLRNRMATQSTPIDDKHPARRFNFSFSPRFGFGPGRKPLVRSSTRKVSRRLRDVRAAKRGILKEIPSLSAIDKLGRQI